MSTSIGFELRDLSGSIEVSIERSNGADDSGLRLLDRGLAPSAGAGLPICTATVKYPGRDYAAAMGWVQLVQSTDAANPETFEPDPLALFAGVNTPFAFFGICPTLFDAPDRPSTLDLRWRARSYLAVAGGAVMSQTARPIAAFTWGFTVESGRVHIIGAAELSTQTWAEHAPILASTYPSWQF